MKHAFFDTAAGKRLRSAVLFPLLTVFLASCGHPSVPEGAEKCDRLPTIFPDYTDVTVPANICPMNFMVEGGAEEVVARLSVGEKACTYGTGNKVVIDAGEWAELRDAARGKSISVEVFARSGERWTAYKPFSINVAEEEIDPYISYRLIQPSYVTYSALTIAQRDVTTFEESAIYDNRQIQRENQGQCINCHSYQNYGTGNMLFHMRQAFGGTMILHDGTLEKVNLKTDSTLSAGVYPAWHPTESLIAFSTNITQQSFHTNDIEKIEVFDTASDLILYDVKTHEVSHISNLPDELEVFPTWSADGKTLYYCSAHFEYRDTTVEHSMEAIQRHQEIKYSIYQRAFDPSTRTFAPPQMLFDAAAMGKSATLPRVSPDGRYLVFSLGDFGCFHVWHNEADIMLMDLRDKSVQPLAGINSPRSESYPSFSSNGRWVMSASRCVDGNYTRPVISYLDKQGKSRKAFLLPQEDPEFYNLFTRSYNRPEFMREPVTVTPQEFAEKAKTEPVNAIYKGAGKESGR